MVPVLRKKTGVVRYSFCTWIKICSFCSLVIVVLRTRTSSRTTTRDHGLTTHPLNYSYPAHILHQTPRTPNPIHCNPLQTRQRTKNTSHHENIARATNLRKCRKQTHSFRPVSLTMSPYSLSCTSAWFPSLRRRSSKLAQPCGGGKTLRKFDLRDNLRNKTNFLLDRFWRCQANLTLLNRYFLLIIFP